MRNILMPCCWVILVYNSVHLPWFVSLLFCLSNSLPVGLFLLSPTLSHMCVILEHVSGLFIRFSVFLTSSARSYDVYLCTRDYVCAYVRMLACMWARVHVYARAGTCLCVRLSVCAWTCLWVGCEHMCGYEWVRVHFRHVMTAFGTFFFDQHIASTKITVSPHRHRQAHAHSHAHTKWHRDTRTHAFELSVDKNIKLLKKSL